jgi:hypothetical protein
MTTPEPMSADEFDAIYAEAVAALDLEDEQWDREWAALHNDPDFTD